MKKSLLFLAVGVTLMTSCSKEMMEAETAVPSPQKSFVSNETEVTQITNFLNTYEAWKINPATSLADMTKADAVWLMEASINYKNAFKFSYWEKQHTRESEYYPSVSSTNELNFTGASILSTFASMDAAIQNQVQTQNHDMVLVVDLYLDETNVDQIGMRGVTANALPISSFTAPVGIKSDDYWFPSSLQGKCDIYSGDYVNQMDAAERVEDIINHNWWFSYYRNTYNPTDVLYYTDIISEHYYPNTGNNPNGLWGGVNMSTCLDPTAMQGVLSQNQNVTMSGIPTGSQLIISDFIGGYIIGAGSPAYNTLDKSYGVPHIQ